VRRSTPRQSPLVFLGTVLKVGEATDPPFPVDERTAVVQVDRIFRAPQQFQALAGPVTLETQIGLPVKVGDQAIFCTTSWLYGKSLAVVEVGRLSSLEAAGLPARIREAEAQAYAAQLRQLAAHAQLIVVGTITGTRPAPGASLHPVGEHDPSWWEASVAVTKVVKGTPPADLRVLFPMSADVLWADAPKLQRLSTVLLLLDHDQQVKGMPVQRLPGWTALDPLEVLQPDQLDTIQSLVAAPGGSSPSPPTQSQGTKTP
jgi:hypothetical protein